MGKREIEVSAASILKRKINSNGYTVFKTAGSIKELMKFKELYFGKLHNKCNKIEQKVKVQQKNKTSNLRPQRCLRKNLKLNFNKFFSHCKFCKTNGKLVIACRVREQCVKSDILALETPDALLLLQGNNNFRRSQFS
ncbi:hypothetical protein OUZ56_028619 [Daphnia magna]|uniref:Uncharacterized protein n=1 Tax=Daphnia magna TaxID=35525 RepID=A0ABR0B4F6_9CRUS|nr:hypothetical protein OUZ56_028619 [Daphnia magna]